MMNINENATGQTIPRRDADGQLKVVLTPVDTRDAVSKNYVDTGLSNKLDATKCTFQTTAPTSAISDGGVHIVSLTSEPATKYDGYIYLIKE